MVAAQTASRAQPPRVSTQAAGAEVTDGVEVEKVAAGRVPAAGSAASRLLPFVAICTTRC